MEQDGVGMREGYCIRIEVFACRSWGAWRCEKGVGPIEDNLEQRNVRDYRNTHKVSQKR